MSANTLHEDSALFFARRSLDRPMRAALSGRYAGRH